MDLKAAFLKESLDNDKKESHIQLSSIPIPVL